MTAVTVDRTGKVWRGTRLLGHVDRWTGRLDRMGRPEPGQWRYVQPNGWTTRQRFATRAAAVEALVSA